MKIRNRHVSNWTRCVHLFAAALPSALCGAEPDSSQFGFLSGEVRSEAPPTGNRPVENAPAATDQPSPSATEVPDGEEKPLLGADDREVWNFLPKWLDFSLSVQSLYDDNIYLNSENEEGAWINRIAPVFRASTGETGTSVWLAEATYAPVLALYSSSTRPGSFDQAMAAAVHFNGNRLRAAAHLAYTEATGNDRYVRDVLTTSSMRAGVQLNYDLTGKTSLESRLLWEKLDRDRGSAGQIYSSDETIALELSALYQITGKTRLGPSLRAGRTASSLSLDRNFVHFLVKVDQDSTAKLRFFGDAGVQLISYDGNYGSTWAPSASLSGRYAMNAFWSLNLNGYSRVTPSPNATVANLKATGVTGSVAWHLTPGLQCSAGAGFEKAREESLSGSTIIYSDTYSFGEFRVSAGRPERHFSLDLFYRHRLADSSSNSRDFSNNQAGLQLNFRY